METELLLARIKDTALIASKTSKPKFFGFLSREEAILAEKTVSVLNVRYSLFGGYEEAERVMLGCFPDWGEEFCYPITPIAFSYRKTDILTHRDFLGSLMALGIKRETVGDILVEEGRSVAFVSSEVATFILSQIEKIGRIGVTLKEGFDFPLPQKGTLTEFTVTVASERLDCVVSAITGVSRSTAAEKIALGLVSVNSVVCEKATKSVAEGEALTVRGSGKFIIASLNARTKKNRIVLVYKKYT